MRAGRCKRLIINLPPRSLKSIFVSVAFPAFMLGHDPTKRIIGVSYSNELSRMFSNDFRTVMKSDWYRRLFPDAIINPNKDTELEIALTARGGRLATSIGGTLTGRGGDLIIIDDPLKAIDAYSDAKRLAVNEFYTSTLLSRLNDKRTGAIIIVMQRVHMDDLTGYVTALSGEWTVLNLPAIAEYDMTLPLLGGHTHLRKAGSPLSPIREPLDVLEALRTTLGVDAFTAQYQQAPVPPGGAMIKRNWVQRYEELPPEHGSFVLQSWDTASKGGPDNDWSVCTTWYVVGHKFYLADVWRHRVSYPDLKAAVIANATKWSAHQVLVEETGTAIGLVEELRYEVTGLTPIKPERDKASRMAIASAKFTAGQVFLPERAPWLQTLEIELFSFPGSSHDDQVDSISQALNNSGPNLYIWERLGS